MLPLQGITVVALEHAVAAGMYAYTNILAALIERGRTGRGRHIDVAMLESLAEWMGYPLYYTMDGADPPPRSAAAHATIYPYGPFAAGPRRRPPRPRAGPG